MSICSAYSEAANRSQSSSTSRDRPGTGGQSASYGSGPAAGQGSPGRAAADAARAARSRASSAARQQTLYLRPLPHGQGALRTGPLAILCSSPGAPSGRRQRIIVARQIARRSEEHTSELQSLRHLVCRLLLEKKKELAHTRSSSHAVQETAPKR